jgi:Fe-S-cluster-containing hydrogenase component 2
MALLINENCTACDACKPVCPNEAISVGDPIYVIDSLRCTECVGAEDEPQCRLVCPADCIVDHLERAARRRTSGTARGQPEARRRNERHSAAAAAGALLAIAPCPVQGFDRQGNAGPPPVAFA